MSVPRGLIHPGLTKACASHSVGRVHLPRRLTALVLLAFWLVATQHCALEAAGLFASHAGEETAATGCCATTTDGCAADGCETVEGSFYRVDSGSLKVATPDLSACLCLLSLEFALLPPATELSPTAVHWLDAADDWVPAWRFERRAAAPAHAPDMLIA